MFIPPELFWPMCSVIMSGGVAAGVFVSKARSVKDCEMFRKEFVGLLERRIDSLSGNMDRRFEIVSAAIEGLKVDVARMWTGG